MNEEIKTISNLESEINREERHYNEERENLIRFGEFTQKSQDRAFSQMFTFSIPIGMLAVLVMYYTIDKNNMYFATFLAFASFVILILSMFCLIEAFIVTGDLHTPLKTEEDKKKNELAKTLETKALHLFKFSTFILLVAMFAIIILK